MQLFLFMDMFFPIFFLLVGNNLILLRASNLDTLDTLELSIGEAFEGYQRHDSMAIFQSMGRTVYFTYINS